MKADSLAKLANAEQATDSAATAAPVTVDANDSKAWWQPVVKELQAFGGANDIANHSLFYIFIIGFVGGLLAS